MFKVSQSKQKAWKACKYRYHLKYIERLVRKVKARPLEYGIIIHELIEEHTEGRNPFRRLRKIRRERGEMFAREKEIYGEILNTAEIVFEHYLEYYKDDPLHFIKMNGKRSEHEFELEIAPGILFVWRVDGFVRSPVGLRYLLENKTGKSIIDEDLRWQDLQTHMYIKCSEMLGLKELHGVCWNFIRSKEPTQPEVLKSGVLSKRKIDTLPGVVLAALEDNELTLAEDDNHTVLLEHARENLPSYFMRKFEPVRRHAMEDTFNTFVLVSQEMAELHGKRREKNIDRHCKWCDYREICATELTGGDVDRVKEREFTIAEEDHEKKAKREEDRKARSRKVASRKRPKQS